MNMKNGVQNIQHLNSRIHLISVIVLTYKNQMYIKETLKSILEQDYPRIELVISDDASGCFNREDIERFIQEHQSNNIESLVININEKNLGTVKHANFIISKTMGDFIKFVPCGDKFYNSNSLKELYRFAFENDSILTSSAVLFCSQDFKINYYKHPNSIRTKKLMSLSPIELFKYLCGFNIIAAVSVLYRRDFFKQYTFDERYRLLEDWPMWLRVSREGVKIYHLDLITMCYADGGISSKDSDAFRSKTLREDLLTCYKLEIIPYINELNFITKQFVKYKFASLNKKRKYFYVKYALFIAYDELKHYIKFLVKSRGSNG